MNAASVAEGETLAAHRLKSIRVDFRPQHLAELRPGPEIGTLELVDNA